MRDKVRKFFQDQRGAYGGVEMMFIVAIVVVVAMSVMGTFSSDTTGLPSAAQTTITTVTDSINSATGTP